MINFTRVDPYGLPQASTINDRARLITPINLKIAANLSISLVINLLLLVINLILLVINAR